MPAHLFHRLPSVLGVALFACACAAKPAPSAKADLAVAVESRSVTLAAGRVEFDLYRPTAAGPPPLVIVAHGFWRSRANMAGWGRHLAGEGFLVAVPDLPAWADHERNGRAMNELIDWLLSNAPVPIDARRIGVVGFSAGGLSTLLAASRDPRITLWVGLDPVDRGGKGAAAAAVMQGRALVLRAAPSSCNANGNAAAIERAFEGRVTSAVFADATHTDPEWPTDWKARLLCGGDSEARRAKFVEAATAALKTM